MSAFRVSYPVLANGSMTIAEAPPVRMMEVIEIFMTWIQMLFERFCCINSFEGLFVGLFLSFQLLIEFCCCVLVACLLVACLLA
jgi:hypothetical protein